MEWWKATLPFQALYPQSVQDGLLRLLALLLSLRSGDTSPRPSVLSLVSPRFTASYVGDAPRFRYDQASAGLGRARYVEKGLTFPARVVPDRYCLGDCARTTPQLTTGTVLLGTS